MRAMAKSRDRETSGVPPKTIVFGIFKRNGWAYTEIVSDAYENYPAEGYPGPCGT